MSSLIPRLPSPQPKVVAGSSLPYLAAPFDAENKLTNDQSTLIAGQSFPGQPAATPGFGRGWMRVAKEISSIMPWREIAHIWVFPPIRTDGREWGTAVIARRIASERVAVCTARYMVLTRGKKRGHGKVEVELVGESPEAVVSDVLQGVQERAGEADPPVEVEPTLWFGAEDDEPTA